MLRHTEQWASLSPAQILAFRGWLLSQRLRVLVSYYYQGPDASWAGPFFQPYEVKSSLYSRPFDEGLGIGRQQQPLLREAQRCEPHCSYVGVWRRVALLQ